MIDLRTLNPEQRQAVEALEGPLLVLAGAGSGKTRVVVHRIANLLAHRVEPEAILAVTFTNKAAAEMRGRVAALTGTEVAERIMVSTFHAFGVSVLRDHIHRLGYRKRFAIFDTQDQLAILKRLLGATHVQGRNFDLYRLLSMISRAKSAGVEPGEVSTNDDYDLMLIEMYPRYQRALKAANAVDFDDLIVLPLRLLREHQEVREAIHGRYQYFMIDEYQDTSVLQVDLLRALAHTANVCAVGDDDQSIYAWRGAEVGNILSFERTFHGAREIKLTQNYRSTGNILRAANAVIARNTARRGKDLWTEAAKGAPIKLVCCADDEEEARYVAEEIDRHRHEPARSGDDFAVLFRTNGQARLFEEALRAQGVPHKVVGGTRFFDRKEVRDAICYLRVCMNPQDDVSLVRIVNYPSRGIGDATLERVGEEAGGAPMWNTLQQIDSVPEVGRSAGAVKDFVDLIERHRRPLRRRRGGLADNVHRLFEDAGLYEAARNSVKSIKAGEAKAANVASLVQSVRNYEERNPKASLAGYLARIALDNRDEDGESETGKVSLLTLHSAKGLEFPFVFLVGMEEGLMPHEGMGADPPDLSEERRLCYVGITRARERLYLSRAVHRRRHGKLSPRTPSRFLEDLPEGTYEEINASAPPAPLTDEDMDSGRDFFQSMRELLDREP